MSNVKYCEYCKRPISDLDDPATDYFRHIRLKYCNECRKLSNSLKASERVKRLRQRKKMKSEYRDEQLDLLREENEIMKEQIRIQREQLERMMMEVTR